MVDVFDFVVNPGQGKLLVRKTCHFLFAPNWKTTSLVLAEVSNMEKYSVYFWRFTQTVAKELDPLLIVVCKIMTITSISFEPKRRIVSMKCIRVTGAKAWSLSTFRSSVMQAFPVKHPPCNPSRWAWHAASGVFWLKRWFDWQSWTAYYRHIISRSLIDRFGRNRLFSSFIVLNQTFKIIDLLPPRGTHVWRMLTTVTYSCKTFAANFEMWFSFRLCTWWSSYLSHQRKWNFDLRC